jgi:hypothetical protein
MRKNKMWNWSCWNKKCGKIKCGNSNYIFLICKKNIANKKCGKIKCEIEVVEK